MLARVRQNEKHKNQVHGEVTLPKAYRSTLRVTYRLTSFSFLLSPNAYSWQVV